LIDVYEQPIHYADDGMSHPTVDYSLKYSTEQFELIFQRMCEDSIRWFQTPLCVVVHPENYVTFSCSQGRAIMRIAREYDMPIWSLDRWHDFWRARASWRMSDYVWTENRMSFTLRGEICEQLWITLPASVGGAALGSVTSNDASAPYEQVKRHDRTLVQAPIRVNATEIRMVAEYR
jgi:hypothetical protein